MDIKKLLGKRIQELRKSKNFTQEYMSELIGIETNSLSNIERGIYYPTAENLNKILKILNVEPNELFTIEHLAPHKELIEEMSSHLKNNEKLARLVYKFFKLVK
ncbi:helix-turn-helix transcriptional regulator [bacterium]|nr:helix-turn-helix transcriptional regulator [bacterium]